MSLHVNRYGARYDYYKQHFVDDSGNRVTECGTPWKEYRDRERRREREEEEAQW